MVNLLDHVLIGVQDIDAATARLRADYGLDALPPGSPVPGVANASPFCFIGQ